MKLPVTQKFKLVPSKYSHWKKIGISRVQIFEEKAVCDMGEGEGYM